MKRNPFKVSVRPSWPELLLICSLSLSLPAWADAPDAEYRRAEAVVENATARLRHAEAALAQAVQTARNGQFGEPDKWSRIEQAVAGLEAAVKQEYPAIREGTATLLRLSPRYRPETITLADPLSEVLRQVVEQKRSLLAVANRETYRISALNEALARIDKAILRLAAGYVTDTMESLLPNLQELGLEAGAVVLGAYFGPVGVERTVVATGAVSALNAFVDLYYNTQGVADKLRVLTDLLRELRTRKQVAEKNHAEVMKAARELYAIEQLLRRQIPRLAVLRGEAGSQSAVLAALAIDAHQRHDGDLKAAAGEALAGLPESSYLTVPSADHSSSPTEFSVKLERKDYQAEVEKLGREWERSAEAVLQGGNPDAHERRVSEWLREQDRRIAGLNKAVRQRQADWRAARTRADQQRDELRRREDHRYRALMQQPMEAADREKAWEQIQKELQSAREAVENALRAEKDLLMESLRSRGVLAGLQREAAIISEGLSRRITEAALARRGEYEAMRDRWRETLAEAARELDDEVYDVPRDTDLLTGDARRLDALLPQWLARSSAQDVRDTLRARAENLRTTGRDLQVRRSRVAALADRHEALRREALQELGGFLDRHGSLMTRERAGYTVPSETWREESLPAEDRYLSPARDGMAAVREQQLRTELEGLFLPVDVSWTAPAFRTDWEAAAARFDDAAQGLEETLAQAAAHRERLETGVAGLVRIAGALSDRSLLAERRTPPEEVLRRELGGASWQPLVERASQWYRGDSVGIPRVAVVGARDLVAEWLGKVLEPYYRGQDAGRVVMVPEAALQPARSAWQQVLALCHDFDAQAAPWRAPLASASAALREAVAPVSEGWQRLPEAARALVRGEHEDFTRAADWLGRYLATREAWLAETRRSADGQPLRLETDLALYERVAAQPESPGNDRSSPGDGRSSGSAGSAGGGMRGPALPADDGQAIAAEFYAAFRAAYEARDEARVMALLDDGWSAGDGTILADLSGNLRRTFLGFDEVRYELSDLKAEPAGAGGWRVEYRLNLTSRQYASGVQHVETSQVVEELARDKAGRWRVRRTLGGRFWPVE